MGAGNLLKTTDRTFAHNTDVEENATAGDKAHDILGGDARLYRISGKNNDSGVAYLDIWDKASPTEGTTEPDFRFRLTALKCFSCPIGAKAGSIAGYLFTTGLSYAAVTVAGGAIKAVDIQVVLEMEKV